MWAVITFSVVLLLRATTLSQNKIQIYVSLLPLHFDPVVYSDYSEYSEYNVLYKHVVALLISNGTRV